MRGDKLEKNLRLSLAAAEKALSESSRCRCEASDEHPRELRAAFTLFYSFQNMIDFKNRFFHRQKCREASLVRVEWHAASCLPPFVVYVTNRVQ